ncbi:MAG: ComEC/Rec2 family competence protein [Pontiella sp.]
MIAATAGLLSVPSILFICLPLLLYSFIIHSRFSTGLTFLAIAMVAASFFLVSVPDKSVSSINRIKNDLPRHNVSLIGTLSDFPEFYASHSDNRGRWNFPVQCEGIQFSNEWKTIRGEIDVHIVGATRELEIEYGQRIKLNGKLNRRVFPGGNSVELKIYSNERLQILPGVKKGSLKTWSRAWRDSAATRLELINLPEQEAVLKALVLGYRKEIPRETLDGFRRTGTLHIFAISGLHVGIVGLLLVVVLKTIGIQRDWYGLWLLPLLSIYVVSTGMKSSALRALTMAAVFVLAPLFRRKPDIPSSVAFAAIVLLLFNPLEIQSAGFIYSFTVVAFIVMVYATVPKSLSQGGLIRRYTMGLVITSTAANLASIPLSALYFGMFSPIALLGNLFVVPLTFCIVLAGWLAILVPFASTIFAYAAIVFVNLLLGSVAWLDAFPGSSWQVNPPPLLSVLLWYGSLIYLFTHATVKKHRVYACCGAGFAVLLALLS